jgi:hypothetical protein
MYAIIADANKLLPFFLPITIKISRKIRIFSLSCTPKITETIAFCHSSSFSKSLRPLLWWQKFSINLIALFEGFNVNTYKENNADLAGAYGDDLSAYYTHYMNCGWAENRVCR